MDIGVAEAKQHGVAVMRPYRRLLLFGGQLLDGLLKDLVGLGSG